MLSVSFGGSRLWCCRSRCRGVAAQNCLDSGNHFFGIKRFDDIVIGAQFQSQHFVKDFSFGGKHDNRGAVVFAYFTTHIVAVNARKHNI